MTAPRTARPPEPRTAAGWRMRDKILETIGILRFYDEHEWSQMICAIEAEALPTVEQIVRRMTKKEPWPQFGVPRGHEATARAAYNAAIASVLARLAALKEQP